MITQQLREEKVLLSESARDSPAAARVSTSSATANSDPKGGEVVDKGFSNGMALANAAALSSSSISSSASGTRYRIPPKNKFMHENAALNSSPRETGHEHIVGKPARSMSPMSYITISDDLEPSNSVLSGNGAIRNSFKHSAPVDTINSLACNSSHIMPSYQEIPDSGIDIASTRLRRNKAPSDQSLLVKSCIVLIHNHKLRQDRVDAKILDVEKERAIEVRVHKFLVGISLTSMQLNQSLRTKLDSLLILHDPAAGILIKECKALVEKHAPIEKEFSSTFGEYFGSFGKQRKLDVRIQISLRSQHY